MMVINMTSEVLLMRMERSILTSLMTIQRKRIPTAGTRGLRLFKTIM